MSFVLRLLLKPVVWIFVAAGLFWLSGFMWYSARFMFSSDDARAAASVVIRDGMLENRETQKLMVYTIYKRSIWACDAMPMRQVVVERRMKVRPGKAVWAWHLPGFTNWWAQFFGRTQSLVDEGLAWVEEVRSGKWKPPEGWEDVAWYSLGIRTIPDNRWFNENLIHVGKRGLYNFYRPKPGCPAPST